MKGRPDGEVRYRDKQREGRFKIKLLCMSLYPTGGMVRVGQARVSGQLKKQNTVLDSEKSACPQWACLGIQYEKHSFLLVKKGTSSIQASTLVLMVK